MGYNNKKIQIKSIYIILYIVFISLFSNLFAKKSTSIIHLKNEIICDKNLVYLEDIVTSSNTLSNDLKKMYITKSPTKDLSKTITAKFINNKLKRLSKIVRVDEYSNCTLKNRYITLTSTEIKNILDKRFNLLKKKYGKNNNSFKYKMKLKRIIKDITYPYRKNVKIYLKPKHRIRLSGNQLFNLMVELDDELYKKTFINTFVTLFGEVYQATSKINKRENLSLNSKSLVLEYQEITGQEQDVVTKDFEFYKYRLKQNLYNGTTLLKKHFKQLPDINRGEEVYMIVKSGSVNLKIPVIALSDSYKGKNSRFKSKKFKKKYICEVLNNQEVAFRR